MDVSEVRAEGLLRELKVFVPGTDVAERFAARLDHMQRTVRLKGFRPGKVPLSHLKRLAGHSTMAEVVETLITETSAKIFEERAWRPALEPSVSFANEEHAPDRSDSGGTEMGDAVIESLLNDRADLTYAMTFEILPEIAQTDFSAIDIERLLAEVDDEDVAKGLKRLAEDARPYASGDPDDKTIRVREGDQVWINWQVEGHQPPAGTAQLFDDRVVVGSDTMFPGLEAGLIGLAPGESKRIEITFPDHPQFGSQQGQSGAVLVQVKEIASPGELLSGDALAKHYRLETLDELQATVRRSADGRYLEMTRTHLAEQLFDAIAAQHDFSVPEGLVTQLLTNDRQTSPQADPSNTSDDPEEDGAPERRAKVEARVRTMLIIGELARKHNITASDDEVRARHPEIAPYAFESVRDPAEARARANIRGRLRNRIFDEKITDFLLELVTVTERKLPVPEFLKAIGRADDTDGEDAVAADDDQAALSDQSD